MSVLRDHVRRLKSVVTLLEEAGEEHDQVVASAELIEKQAVSADANVHLVLIGRSSRKIGWLRGAAETSVYELAQAESATLNMTEGQRLTTLREVSEGALTLLQELDDDARATSLRCLKKVAK